ncbi:ArsR family transcriptional regulator [Janibacter hoylei PVAS-1]|uniref:ArsR family transcriptional regulator n=2 Tax=Janibacter hoylei PVAS-1 TaxID=1210046 RepID=A0A444AZB0_9MICO|nr:metalloregulator ArsR/SmtB family transcription factor [Janibacter hoylei]RWU81466.1 ArsR family transcriptional regulator [Janibacter hoylei PVAS-1]
MTINGGLGEIVGMEDRGARAALFHALAEPTRLALLEHLASGEHRVRDLVDHMHLAQSTVSKHLACLRDCGLVTLRTEGRASWFALADPARLSAVLEDADAFLAASGMLLSLRDHRDHDQLTAEEL